MLKNTLILLAVSLPILGYADEEGDCLPYCLVPPEPIESCQVPVGYFWPGLYQFGNCCWDIGAWGEFIYWEVNRDSICTIGTKREPSTDLLTSHTQTLVHHQGYRPGFKVGASIGIPRWDNWEFEVEYTWFHHQSTNHFNTSPTGSIAPAFFLASLDPALFFFSPASSLKSVLRFNLDYLHATIGRSMYLSRRFIVDANVGLKAWWSKFDNSLTFNLIGGGIGTQHSKSGLWGIGPYVNIDVKALLWCGTYLFGDIGVYNPYTRFNKLHSNTNFPANAIAPALNSTETTKKSHYTTQLQYEGEIGLGWQTYLCCNTYHVDFCIGWDFMTNWIRGGFATEYGQSHKEFYYQGLMVKARFDF